ncbi:MAG: hypothetical protein ACOYED_01200 [Peptococcia bacterium]|jgi:hypothetical protein
MISLWNKNIEQQFFNESINFVTSEQLFYLTNNNKYLAYWPKNYKGRKNTLQSRNSLIGKYTEKWCTDLIQNIIKGQGLFAVQGAICEDLSLTKASPADVIISKSKDIYQKPEDILVIFEVKMSIVWNWERMADGTLVCIGDYKTHQGNPSLLRSDSMLKAIGKSINIRISNSDAFNIPIVILGNTPITNNYFKKVDNLKATGIIQGFWSLNPNPLDDDKKSIKNTNNKGFLRIDTIEELKKLVTSVLLEERSFFSGMKSNKELGKIIELANKGTTYEKKAELFLKLIKE